MFADRKYGKCSCRDIKYVFPDNLYVQIDVDGRYVACPYESLGNDSILNSSSFSLKEGYGPFAIEIGIDLFLIQMFYALCAGTADVVAESLL